MDEPTFGQRELLAEASRLNPIFARTVREASTDEQVASLVDEAKDIVNQASDQAWV